MNTSDPQLLVSTDWLADAPRAPRTCACSTPAGTCRTPGRDARAEYAAAHIPGARFFDIDEISDDQSDLPHMAPPVEKFVSADAGDGHRRRPPGVVYDSAGLFSAARVWWLFRLFGKEDVAVLDGGLPKWRAEGRPLEDGRPILRDRHFTARRNAGLVRDVTQVAATAKLGDAQIVDARSPARFRGDEPEPRPGLRAGHIPGAKNVHYATLLNPDGTMKDAGGAARRLRGGGGRRGAPAITTCGSGISAAILSLALERLGNRGARALRRVVGGMGRLSRPQGRARG